MNLSIPDGWLEIDCEQFWKLLDEIDWKRGAHYNAEYFHIKDATGVHSRDRQVAIHTTENRYWIDPTFFKPA